MSYDIQIGGEHFDITCNLAPIFCHVFSHEDGIRSIYGMKGCGAKGIICRAISLLVNDFEQMEQIEAENGWGTVDQCLSFLFQIYKASRRNPAEVWSGD